MGVIQIQNRSAQLGNIGGVQGVQWVNREALFRSNEQVARAISGMGNAAMHVAGQLHYISEKENQKKLTEGMNALMTAYNSRMASVAPDGTAVGRMRERFSSDKGGEWMKSCESDYEDSLREVKDSVGLNDQQFAMLKDRATSFRQSWRRQQVGYANSVYEAQRKQGIAGQLASQTQTYMMTGDDSQLKLAFMDDVRENKGIVDPELQNQQWSAFLCGVRRQTLAQQFDLINDSEMTKEQAKGKFDELEAVVRDGKGGASFLTPSLAKDVEPAQAEESNRQLLADIRKARQYKLASIDADERERVEAMVDDFNRAEPDIQRLPIEVQSDAYEKQAEQFRESSPRMYNIVMSKALNAKHSSELQRARDAAARAKLEAKFAKDRDEALENDLWRMAVACTSEADYSDPEGAALAAERRTDLMEKLSEGYGRGRVQYSTYNGISKLLGSFADDEQSKLMKYFMSELGVSSEDLNGTGSIRSDLVRKGKTRVMFGDDHRKIPYADVARMSLVLKGELDAAPKNGDRQKLVKDIAYRVKSEYVRGKSVDELIGALHEDVGVYSDTERLLNRPESRADAEVFWQNLYGGIPEDVSVPESEPEDDPELDEDLSSLDAETRIKTAK